MMKTKLLISELNFRLKNQIWALKNGLDMEDKRIKEILEVLSEKENGQTKDIEEGRNLLDIHPGRGQEISEETWRKHE